MFPYASAAGMLLHINGEFTMGNHLFCPTVSLLTDQLRGVGQGRKQAYLYLWYLLFQEQLDR